MPWILEEGQLMVPSEAVAYVWWSPEQGEKLKEMRGKLTADALIELLIEKTLVSTTRQTISLLENGQKKYVAFELVCGFCKALDRDIRELLPAVRALA